MAMTDAQIRKAVVNHPMAKWTGIVQEYKKRPLLSLCTKILRRIFLRMKYIINK